VHYKEPANNIFIIAAELTRLGPARTALAANKDIVYARKCITDRLYRGALLPF